MNLLCDPYLKLNLIGKFCMDIAFIRVDTTDTALSPDLLHNSWFFSLKSLKNQLEKKMFLLLV